MDIVVMVVYIVATVAVGTVQEYRDVVTLVGG